LKQAEALARTAVEAAETKTDDVGYQAWTHEDLATVLERAGRIDDAREALERSLELWERKGCVPCAARARAQIDTLGHAK
jgi:Flp pilus assembly protein TadD